jgi:hypothetical protein
MVRGEGRHRCDQVWRIERLEVVWKVEGRQEQR